MASGSSVPLEMVTPLDVETVTTGSIVTTSMSLFVPDAQKISEWAEVDDQIKKAWFLHESKSKLFLLITREDATTFPKFHRECLFSGGLVLGISVERNDTTVKIFVRSRNEHMRMVLSIEDHLHFVSPPPKTIKESFRNLGPALLELYKVWSNFPREESLSLSSRVINELNVRALESHEHGDDAPFGAQGAQEVLDDDQLEAGEVLGAQGEAMETGDITEGQEQGVQEKAQEEQGVQVQEETLAEAQGEIHGESTHQQGLQETHKDHGEAHVESQIQQGVQGVQEEARSQVCSQEVIPSLTSKRRERLEEEVGRSQALIVLPGKKPRRIMEKASTSRARVPQAKASRMPRRNVEEQESSREDTSVETAEIIAMNLKLNEICTEDDKGYIWGNNVTFLIRCSSVSKASIFTNSRMLDTAYAYQLYKAMVHLKAPIIPNVVLRPMLFIQDVENPQTSSLMFKSVPHFEHVFTHFFHCDTKECPDVYATQDMPHAHNLAKRRFLARCRFEPVDGQHFCYACSVFAKQDFDQGRLNRDIYETRFHFIPTLICLYNDDKKYILESERLNNEPTQMKKKSSCAEILTKARLIWETLGSPKSTLMKTTSKQQADNLVKFYTLLSGVVPRGHADRKEVITTFKAVRDRYFDYTNIIFRENEVFQSILGVCNAYHKGELSYESSHVSGKKKRVENKEMTVRMWRPLKTTPNKYVTIACEKLSKQEWFFGKKEKVLNMEDRVNALVKEDACIEAISSLLEHKDISVKECKVDMDVIKQISASLTTKEKSWAHKWIRESCAGKFYLQQSVIFQSV